MIDFKTILEGLTANNSEGITDILELLNLDPKDITMSYKLLNENAKAPARAHGTDTGWDLTTTSIEDFPVQLEDGTTYTALKLHMGIAVKPPEGYYFDLRCRSGFSKCGWVLGNGLGTIDKAYRGELMGIIHPIRDGLPKPKAGERHFQLVLQKYENDGIALQEVNSFEETDRGDKGFGSTGT